jgi:hypothetical protein
MWGPSSFGSVKKYWRRTLQVMGHFPFTQSTQLVKVSTFLNHQFCVMVHVLLFLEAKSKGAPFLYFAIFTELMAVQ